MNKLRPGDAIFVFSLDESNVGTYEVQSGETSAAQQAVSQLEREREGEGGRQQER